MTKIYHGNSNITNATIKRLEAIGGYINIPSITDTTIDMVERAYQKCLSLARVLSKLQEAMNKIYQGDFT